MNKTRLGLSMFGLWCFGASFGIALSQYLVTHSAEHLSNVKFDVLLSVVFFILNLL